MEVSINFENVFSYLSKLYKFERLSKIYSAGCTSTSILLQDLEQTAAHTPLTIMEIEELKIAAGELLAITADCMREYDIDSHIHITLLPESEKFTFTMWIHCPMSKPPHNSELQDFAGSGFTLVKSIADELLIQRTGTDIIFSITKGYTALADGPMMPALH